MNSLPSKLVSPGTPEVVDDPKFMPCLVHRIDVSGDGEVLVEAKIGAHGYRTVGTYVSSDEPVMYVMLGVNGWQLTASGDDVTVDIVSS